MKGNLIFVLLVVFCVNGLFTTASAEDYCHYSTEGRDFWFGFMQNRLSGATHFIEITVTSQLGAQFTLTYGPSDIPIGTYTVAPNSSIPVRIDYNQLESQGSAIENKGIHLVSTNPVNVYAFNYRTRSSDVAVIYPTESLGNEYFAICYTPHVQSGRETNSEFLIVATADNTNVNITPSVNTDSGFKANSLYKVTLNKGQTYQVQSSIQDLTGSYVSSDKPIAFYAGSMATSIPVVGTSYDHLYEQISPISTWGREFYVVPLKLRTKDTYRVLAAEDGTSVRIDAINSVITLNRGGFYEFELNSNQPSHIISSKKILLAQYCRSEDVDGGSSGVGDPFMTIISPVIQKINDVTFVAYESSLIQNIFYVNIIALASEVNDITLDGVNIGPYFSFFPNSEYAYAQVKITKGPHRLKTNANKEGFLAFVYGFGDQNSTESYGYGVGFNLDIQLEIVGNWTTFTPIVCQGNEIKLSVEDNFDSYLWSTGETGPSINVSKEMKYWVRGTTARGCVKADTLYLKVSDPKMNLGKDTSSCGPGKIVLKADAGFKSYRWQDGSTNQTFTVVSSGDYSVTGTNEYGCQASDAVHVDVFQVPEVKILGDTLHCGTFTSDLKVEVTNADANLWNYPGAAKWTCNSTDLEFQNNQPDGVRLVAKKPGLYTIHYTLTTKNGCSDSDSFSVGFYETPLSSFDVISPQSTDKCATYERIVNYTGKSGPGAKFTWDFGGLMVLDTIGFNQFKISIGANKPNRTITLDVEEHGCKSVQTSKIIGVKPTFSFTADKVHGCDALCVQFKSEITIQDKVSFHWTFGDGEFSEIQNPIHCYKDTGKFDVSLMVTNMIDGCRNGSVEPEMIKIYKTPIAKLTADPEFCYGDTAIFQYLNKKAISNCKWFTKGNQLISSENTSATYLLKNEISEVGFLVEENGCSCDTFKVKVKRKPNFDFMALAPELCLGEPTKLKAIEKDANLLYSWSVDSISEVKGDSLVHVIGKPGFYSVTLKAYSQLTGCSDQITKSNYLQIHPLPEPAFLQNYRVATIEHSDIAFTNQTVGAERYLWDFGDGKTSSETTPEHHYDAIGEYQVILYATTSFGCVDTISSRVKIIPFTFYTPNAFRPDSEITENQTFLPITEGIDPENYSFQIYNRVGSTVFETTNPQIGWDGNFSGGAASGPGIYIWIVKYIDIQGYRHSQKGTVMLVR